MRAGRGPRAATAHMPAAGPRRGASHTGSWAGGARGAAMSSRQGSSMNAAGRSMVRKRSGSAGGVVLLEAAR